MMGALTTPIPGSTSQTGPSVHSAGSDSVSPAERWVPVPRAWYRYRSAGDWYRCAWSVPVRQDRYRCARDWYRCADGHCAAAGTGPRRDERNTSHVACGHPAAAGPPAATGSPAATGGRPPCPGCTRHLSAVASGLLTQQLQTTQRRHHFDVEPIDDRHQRQSSSIRAQISQINLVQQNRIAVVRSFRPPAQLLASYGEDEPAAPGRFR